jgi:Fungal chitosanase of glycosyl hydrolase group 75
MKLLNQILALAIAFTLPASTVAQSPQPVNLAISRDACPAISRLLDFDVYRFGELRGQAPIWQLSGGPGFFFSSGLAIDADGAPNAYNADDTGLDYLFNAGQPGQWDGIVQDEEGNPFVQGPDDPFPGYYISCTALFDRTKRHNDPARFVDATQIPYVALPGDLAERTGARLGDIVLVFSERTGRYSYAIFADIGALGEGSIALAENLGIWSDARRGGSRAGVSYVVFPGSGDGQPKSVDEINRRGTELTAQWSGAEGIVLCAGMTDDKIANSVDGNRDTKTVPAEPTVAPGERPADAAAN